MQRNLLDIQISPYDWRKKLLFIPNPVFSETNETFSFDKEGI